MFIVEAGGHADVLGTRILGGLIVNPELGMLVTEDMARLARDGDRSC